MSHRILPTFFAALGASVVLAQTPAALAADWPCYRGPNRNGILNEKLDYGFGRALFDFSSGQPKRVWEFRERGGHAYSTGLLHDGSIYCFTADHFVCLDLATGQPRWQEHGGGSALLTGDKFIRVKSSGELVIGRISPQGFDELQTASFGMTEIKNAPAYANGRLIARNDKGQVVCLQIGRSMTSGAPTERPGTKAR